MARFNPLQNSFTGGVLSARLAVRNDIEQVNSGLRQGLNGIVLPHGGHMRRPGTRYVAEAKNRLATTALIEFDVSIGQQYVMEWGKTGANVGYIRFFANAGVVETFVGSGIPLEVATIFDDPQNVRVAQNADKMWVVHPNVYPYILQRTGFAAFNIVKATWAGGFAPCRPVNATTTTIAYDGAGNLAASAAVFTPANDIGRAVKIDDINVYEIVSCTATTAVVTVKAGAGGVIGASVNWALGLFSNTEGCRAVGFHQGRLWYGGATSVPDWVVGSVSDAFDNFDRGTTTGATPTSGNADRSIGKRIVSDQINTIYWIKSFGQILAVGCSGGEFRIFGSNNDILTPTTTSVRAATNAGSAFVPAIRVDNVAMFVQRASRGVYELKYDVLRDQITNKDLFLFSEDAFDADATGLTGCRRIAYQQIPDNIIWCVHANGTVVSLTYEPDQKVIARGDHSVGSTVDGKILDISTIQNLEGTADTPWLVGDFTVGGVSRRYIMYMANYYRPSGINRRSTQADKIAALNTAYFVDVGLDTTLGAPALTVSGLSHLEGCTVSLLLDGKVHPDVVVTAGAVTANFAATHWVVGLPMPYRGETERFVGGGKIGTDISQATKIARVGIVLQNTLGGSVGVGNGITRQLQPLEYGTSGATMNASPPLFSGELDVAVEGAWKDDATVYWENTQPLPMTVLAVAPRAKTGER